MASATSRRRQLAPPMLLLLLATSLPGGAALALGVSRTVTPTTGCRAAMWRTGAVSMLEAFDLMPVMECLKLDNMDAVEQCMDAISPWMEITEEGEFNLSPNAINGFIGGSVGVVGTLISTMVKKTEVKDRLKCTYCDGTGQILCGHCLGAGTLTTMSETGAVTTIQCPNCEGTGTVVCINCQGSGLSVPDEFLQVLGDTEVGFTEQDYIGLFDANKQSATEAALIKSANKPPTPPPSPVGAATRDSDASVGSRPEDFTGGLG